MTGPSGRQGHYRRSLRNGNINYRNGWFFVTVQVCHNKSIFGAIVGECCALNGFGQQVWEYWRGLPARYPELEVFESVLMPNHFHALVRVHYRASNKRHQLGFLMSRFKGGTSYLYGQARRAKLVEDIGEHLWQRDYWDDLVTSDREFAEVGRYIRDNPKNWSRDRYGLCTSYAYGDLELLNAPRIAFVASQGYFVGGLRPRKIWTAKAAHFDAEAARGAGGQDLSPVLISTFTSAQEREALRRALAKDKRVIQVVPQGLPCETELSREMREACCSGRALLLSPQPSGSRLNKKVAAWCNEYVLRHAHEIWVGDIAPNGMLLTMLTGLNRAENLPRELHARYHNDGRPPSAA